MSYYFNLIVFAFVGWSIFSIYYIHKEGKSKNLDSINPYISDSIPSVFTTLGVLGIYFGLIEFQVDIITQSIPKLLEGLKTAFITSIWGIILSLIFSKVSKTVYGFLTSRSLARFSMSWIYSLMHCIGYSAFYFRKKTRISKFCKDFSFG